MIRPRLRQPTGERKIVFPEDERSVGFGMAVVPIPTVQRIARAPDGVLEVHDRDSFDFQHILSSLSRGLPPDEVY